MTEEMIGSMARAITAEKITAFYADEKNQKEFEQWLKERETHEHS